MGKESCIMALRLFGLSQQQVESVLKQAAEDGCPGLRLLSKEDEFVVCVNAKADDQQQAQNICDHWEKWFREKFGSAVFGRDEVGLPIATLTALAQEHKLFVAADEPTGRILEEQIRQEEFAQVVYDFGQESYRHPKKSQRIQTSNRLLKKHPGCPIQPLAERTHEALAVSGADWAVSYSKPKGSKPGFVVVSDAKTTWLKVLPQSDDPDTLAVNWMLDMLRRLVLALPMDETVQQFSYGEAAPELPVIRNVPTINNMANAMPLATEQRIEMENQASPVVQQAAQKLFDENAEFPTEKIESNGYVSNKQLAVCAVMVLVIAAMAVLVMELVQSLKSNGLGNVGYGTVDYDTAAWDYLLDAQSSNGEVAAYLALPKLGGTLVYQQGASQPKQNTAVVLAAEGESVAGFTGKIRPGTPHSNVVLACPSEAIEQLGKLDEQELLSQNSGFTIYTNSNVYRYKIAAVYYWDPSEVGPTAFDLYNLQDLTNYQDFLTFLLGMKARSLYDMPVDLQDSDCFATLVTDASDGSGKKLVITGRQQREDETGILYGKQITQADQPLLPLVVYQQTEQEVPSIETLQQYWVNWYVTGGATSSDIQEASGMPQEDDVVATGEIVEESNSVTPTEEPSSSEQPEESAQPSAQPTTTPGVTATPKPSGTPKPTASPSTSATSKPSQETATPTPTSGSPAATPTPTAAPTVAPTATPAPTQAPSGPTITVTMNGIRQEMDLVECLAMIARAEMGAGAPIEAYKAQMIAAHSWILSQGGAPSVTGREPSASIRQAAKEVANIIVTYNGRVAFTPYFASAAYGTNPSQEVWGSSRPYLVAVDSPYDQQYATNWKNTRVFTVEEVAARASEKLGQDLYAYSENPADWMGDLVKNASGYVLSMRVGNATITGMKLQESVLAGFSGRAIRSAAFDISYSDGNFSITTYGYGHGCGMSQYGAWGYAANGWSYAQILAHYYPGTTLSTIN